MSLFKPKAGLSSKMMTALVYENVKIRASEISNVLEKVGAIYDELENQLIVMAVNYEIMKWELSKSNSKDKIEKVINDVYDRFFSSLRVSPREIEEYKSIMNRAKIRIDELLFSIKNQFADKTVLTYRLVLELQNVSLALVDRVSEQEFIFLVDGWYKIAKQVNDSYKLSENQEDKKWDQPIDFDF